MNKEEISLLKWYKEMGVGDLIALTPSKKESIKKESYNNMPKTTEKLIKEDISLKRPSDLEDISREISNKATTLEELKNAVLNFDGLSITKTATNTVFSDGNPLSEVMVIGEAPGANEDETGIPFCGQSGQLMDKMFSFIGLTREKNLYITNSIFWRPPGNRKPTQEESSICLPFVEKHIALIKPKLLIFVGSTSAQALLNSTETVTKLRMSQHSYKNQYLDKEIPVAVLFHPSYLLRQSSQKKTTWNDLLKIRKNYLDN